MTTHAHGLHGPISQLKSGLIGLGAALAILGVLAIAAPWVASTVMDYMVGGALIAAGVTQLGSAASTLTWRGFWLTLLCGSLSLVAGTGMIVLPKAGIEALVVFLGLILLFESAAKLAAAFSIRGDFPWGWLLIDGVITGLLGSVLLTSRPAAAAVLLGVFVGVNLLSSGVMFAAAGLSLRRAERLG
jgi:uncharacterized membrane protein HdeD (DUF308 family)